MKNSIIHTILMSLLLLAACTARQANEQHPAIHFRTATNWTGEPAGLVRYDGMYHLFFQYNPEQPYSGNIHWGHAVSENLLDWELLPITLFPEGQEQLHGGSIIADEKNTSGLSDGTTSPLFLYYTHIQNTRPTVGIVYSKDQGLTWTKQPRPLENEYRHLRNPQVSWNTQLNQWLMTVSTGSSILFFTSDDCLNWNYLNEFGKDMPTEGGWESSSFFPITSAETGEHKWVLLINMQGGPAQGAPATRYFVGDFDGHKFTLTQTKELWLDYGRDNYANMTFNNLPDNRTITIGWMNCWDYANLTPQDIQRGQMTTPRELTLVPESNYYLVASNPVKELNDYKHSVYHQKEIRTDHTEQLFRGKKLPHTPFLVDLVFDYTNHHAIWGARDYGVRLKTRSGHSLQVGYNNEYSFFYIDRSGLPESVFSEEFGQPAGAVYTAPGKEADWQLLIGSNSVELFACGNRVAITSLLFTDEPFETIELYSEKGTTRLIHAEITTIRNNN